MKMKILIAMVILVVGIATCVFGKDRWEWTDKEALSIAGMVVLYLTVWWSIYSYYWITENSHRFWFWYAFSNKEPSETPWKVMGIVAYVFEVACWFVFLFQQTDVVWCLTIVPEAIVMALPLSYVITKEEDNRLRYIHIGLN